MSVCASNLQERILSKISVDENGCWNWTGCKNSEGYGNLSIGSRRDGTRRTVKAHRASYAAFVGEIPAGKDICHRVCDHNWNGFETCGNWISLDAVPVVRCCQCKNGIVLQHSDFVVCHRGRMKKMDFCSYGERKEGADLWS